MRSPHRSATAPLPLPEIPLTELWGPAAFHDHAGPVTQEDATVYGSRLAENLLPGQMLFIYDFLLGAIVYTSPQVLQFLGYPPDVFTAAFSYELMHPDDREQAFEGARLAHLYARAHPEEDLTGALLTMDNRLRHAAGHYIRVFYQEWITARNPTTGAILRAVALMSDITAHKKTNEVSFTFSPPGFAAFVHQQLAAAQADAPPADRPLLSAREQQVVALVVRGLTSRQIACELGMSHETVRTHRRNIWQKVPSHDLREIIRHLDGNQAK